MRTLQETQLLLDFLRSLHANINEVFETHEQDLPTLKLQNEILDAISKSYDEVNPDE
jgi:hypothetical protein